VQVIASVLYTCRAIDLEGYHVALLKEAIWALALVGVPIGLFTLAIAWWAMRNGHLQDADDSKAIGLALKAMSKKKVEPENDNRDLISKKWTKFGGGFYGIVAFFTYIVIEVTEITTMIANIGGLWAFIKQLNINLIINFFIDALLNFITAMVWPVFWLNRIDGDQPWLWFIAAYAGYLAGLQLAQRLNQRASGPES